MPSRKTLYLSDLDGTLLRSDQTLSPFTKDTVNRLIARGMLFSYATARSIATASLVTEGLHISTPVIVYNGAFVLDSTRRPLLSRAFSSAEATCILDALLAGGIMPIVYATVDGKERFSYDPDRISPPTRRFIATRKDDRKRPVPTEELYAGEIFHFACIGTPETLFPLYERLRTDFPCVCYREAYSGEQWLEIHPRGATKAEAALALKAMLGCNNIVCFGDGENDIPLFEIADECYAVENAAPRLKEIATAILPANDADGVARWLDGV